MGKGRIFGTIALVASVITAAAWSGCGNSNDQGISFRSLGFFMDGTGTAGDQGRCGQAGKDVAELNEDELEEAAHAADVAAGEDGLEEPDEIGRLVQLLGERAS